VASHRSLILIVVLAPIPCLSACEKDLGSLGKVRANVEAEKCPDVATAKPPVKQPISVASFCEEANPLGSEFLVQMRWTTVDPRAPRPEGTNQLLWQVTCLDGSSDCQVSRVNIGSLNYGYWSRFDLFTRSGRAQRRTGAMTIVLANSKASKESLEVDFRLGTVVYDSKSWDGDTEHGVAHCKGDR
jgi:hypothetical protein